MPNIRIHTTSIVIILIVCIMLKKILENLQIKCDLLFYKILIKALNN